MFPHLQIKHWQPRDACDRLWVVIAQAMKRYVQGIQRGTEQEWALSKDGD